MRFHYVVSRMLVPVTTAETVDYGLDLDGDGVVDNRLGGVLADLAAFGIPAQASIDQNVLAGNITLLADLETPDFTTAAGAGFQLFDGSNANPPACGSDEMVTCTGSGTSEVCSGCGDDLTGSATFDVIVNSNPQMTGPITGGAFEAGSSGAELSLQIAVGSGTPIDMDLVDAHVLASGLSANAIGDPATETDPSSASGMVIAGGVLQSELDSTVIPGLVPLFVADQTTYCGAYSTGNCNPDDDTTCAVLEMLMDHGGGAMSTCKISAASVESSTLVAELLSPDLALPQGSAISVGVKVYAVGAQFTVPGEGSGEGSD